jgi:glucan phosphorylase
MNSILSPDPAAPGSAAASESPVATIGPFLARTRIAYFSMEIAARPEMHTYGGGLGVLAGDTARSCADLGIPAVFVTLVSRRGYLRQEISASGEQIEHADPWNPEAFATPLRAKVAVLLEEAARFGCGRGCIFCAARSAKPYPCCSWTPTLTRTPRPTAA